MLQSPTNLARHQNRGTRSLFVALALWLIPAFALAGSPPHGTAPGSGTASLPKSLTVYYVAFGAEGYSATTPENIRQRSQKFTVTARQSIIELDRLLHSESGEWPFIDQDTHLRIDAPDGTCLFLVDHYGVVRRGKREYILTVAAFQCLGHLLDTLLTEDKRQHPRKMPKPPSEPPLVAAVNDGDYARVKALLARGASANTRDKKGTALTYAVQADDERLVRLLLEKGADPNTPDGQGTPALLHAEWVQNSLAITRLLLAHKANVNSCDTEGATALYLAAGAGNVELTKLLLEHGADPNFRKGTGPTALMSAAYKGRSQTVALLLAHGADPAVQAEDGTTALKLAQEGGDAATIALLEKAATR